ncbi:MAG TPA: hypothetical protein PLK80_02000 [bacterium]|nr:hypothetical protein [bacterium]
MKNDRIKKQGANVINRGPGAHHAGTWVNSKKIAFYTIIIALGMTAMGVYALHLKIDIDRKYILIDEYKMKNNKLDVEIRKLEAQVDGLRSYKRIQETLSDAGYEMSVPAEALYLKLNDEQKTALRTEGEAQRARAGIF